MMRGELEFYGVAYRRQDGDEAWRLSSEGTAVPVLFQLYIHGVEMTISIVDAYVPDALVAVLGGVMEVGTQVETVIHGQQHVVWTLVYVGVNIVAIVAIFIAATGGVGHGRYLCGHRHAVSAAHGEGGSEVYLLGYGPLHGDV